MPGCRKRCCGPDCALATDEFGRESLGSDLTELAGTWSITDGTLRTSDTDARLSFNENLPGTVDLHRASVRVRGADGDKPRLMLCIPSLEATQPTYVAFELEIGSSGTIRVFERGSNPTTEAARLECDYSTSADTWYTIKMCIWTNTGNSSIPNAVSIYVGSSKVGSTTCLNNYAFPGGESNGEWGVATGDQADSVQFDDLKVLTIDAVDGEDCPDCNVCPFPPTDSDSDIWFESHDAEAILTGTTGPEGCDFDDGTYQLSHYFQCLLMKPVNPGSMSLNAERRSATSYAIVWTVFTGLTYEKEFDVCSAPELDTLHTLDKADDPGNGCTYPATATVEFTAA